MKRLKCGCRWDGWTMRRCARHREAGRLGADILGIPPPNGGNTMKAATRECVVCGGPIVPSGVIDPTFPMHASCASRIAPDLIRACEELTNTLLVAKLGRQIVAGIADWGVINNAMIRGSDALGLIKGTNLAQRVQDKLAMIEQMLERRE